MTYSNGGSILVAAMADALHFDPNSSSVVISTATRPWEMREEGAINEGPVGFVANGITRITYSASIAYGKNDYCAGILINYDGNMLNPSSWTKEGPIFDHHGNIYAPGSLVFVPSPDNSELWALYHANPNDSCNPYTCRYIGMQKVLVYSGNGYPVLGYPVGQNIPMNVPSGEQGFVGNGSGLPDWGAAFGDYAEGNYNSGIVVGQWSPVDRNTNSNSSLGPGINQIFSPWNPNFENYTLNADLRWNATGTSDSYPKYGVYAAYADSNNFVTVWIDIKYGVVATDAVVNGQDQGFQNCILPSGFDKSQFNNLQVNKNGSLFTITLSGVQVTGACQGRSFDILNGQIGLITEDTLASYRNVYLFGPLQ